MDKNLFEEKSIKIGNIIDTVNSIFEKSNIFALNAAIEPERAGKVNYIIMISGICLKSSLEKYF